MTFATPFPFICNFTITTSTSTVHRAAVTFVLLSEFYLVNDSCNNVVLGEISRSHYVGIISGRFSRCILVTVNIFQRYFGPHMPNVDDLMLKKNCFAHFRKLLLPDFTEEREKMNPNALENERALRAKAKELNITYIG